MKCFHELFTCKYSRAYSSSCAHIIAHYIVVVFVKNGSTHLHEYFHHCLHVFTACMFMYSLHVFSPCKYQYLCIRHPIDWGSINCSHASIHAHTPHHVHKSLYTLTCFFYDKLVVHMCIYTISIACMYSLHVFSNYNHRHMCIVYDNRTTVVPWNISMNCLHASIHAHTHHHVHILLHTILSLFLLKIVVHICMNSFTIVCMYSLHACSCIHVFSPCKYQYLWIVYDNRSTEVPLIVPMQVSMYILLIMCTNHCTL